MGAPSKKQTSSASNIGLTIDNEICFEKTKVAEKFNDFFTSVASALVMKLPLSTGFYRGQHTIDFYKDRNAKPDNFTFSAVDEESILNIVNSICINKATGMDNLPAKFLKLGCKHILTPLTCIINLSIKSSIIPAELKCARVVPIYKKNLKTYEGNYRPVSVLSIVSKILERVVYIQVEHYLTHNNLLYEFQSGFRPGYSTDTCLIHLTDLIKTETGKGNYTGMVIINLQKAFDTVDHHILLEKLSACGMNKQSVEWFRSYLMGRKQVVDLNGTFSSFNNISCGVPQGSILGPLLFSLYINDMKSAVDCKLMLYADDSALIVSSRDVDTIELTLSNELIKLSNWLVDNKLSLHLGKTESILFGSSRNLKKTSKLKVNANGIDIAANNVVKYLGADLEQNLSGECMGVKVVKKVNSRLKYLYRKGKYLDHNSKKLLVNSLVQCHYDYACSSWYSSLSSKTENRLQASQY
jgi:hypothetical protein